MELCVNIEVSQSVAYVKELDHIGVLRFFFFVLYFRHIDIVLRL